MKKNSLKKNLFAFFCLVLMNFGISGYGMNEPKQDEKFGDWTVACMDGADKKKICFLTQQINNTTEDKKNEVLAIYQIGRFKGGKDLYINQIMPLGVAVKPGTSIISDGKLIIKGEYTACTTSGCNALAEISKEDLKQFLGAEKNEVAIMLFDGKQINFPISKKGLKEGLKVLK